MHRAKTADLKPDVRLQDQQRRVRDRVAGGDDLLVYHSIGAGKCVRGDTPLATAAGVVPFASLFAGLPPDAPAEAAIPAPPDLRVLAHVAHVPTWVPVRTLHRRALPPTERTLVVTATDGSRLEATAEHRLRRLEDGALDWPRVDALAPGDLLLAVGPTAAPLPERIAAIRGGSPVAADDARVEPYRVVEVAAIEPGEAGGVVYDLEVDRDDFDDKNYALGAGGLVSHNSLAGLAAAEAVGGPYAFVSPASLRTNSRKEVERFTNQTNPAAILSYEDVARGKSPGGSFGTVIIDEAQNLRNPKSLRSKAVADLASRAGRKVLLSGTPIVNSPGDLAVPLSILSGEPVTPAEFESRFVGKERVPRGFWAALRGVRPAYRDAMRDEAGLESLFRGRVDYHAPLAAPVEELDERVPVEMSPDQAGMHRWTWGKIPWTTRWKLSRDYPLTAMEARNLTGFLTGPRQAATSTFPFMKRRGEGAALEAFERSAKLQRAVGELEKEFAANPAAKALVFSNFIDAGLEPYSAALTARGVPHGVFKGGLSDAERKRLVEDYNSGKLKALLLGPSGSEGLSTKRTTLIQQIDPYWNSVRGKQNKGRGVRFDSHLDLPPEERKVRVQRYIATLPPGRLAKVLGMGPGVSADEALERMAARKEELNERFLETLRRVGSEKRGSGRVRAARAGDGGRGVGTMARRIGDGVETPPWVVGLRGKRAAEGPPGMTNDPWMFANVYGDAPESHDTTAPASWRSGPGGRPIEGSGLADDMRRGSAYALRPVDFNPRGHAIPEFLRRIVGPPSSGVAEGFAAARERARAARLAPSHLTTGPATAAELTRTPAEAVRRAGIENAARRAQGRGTSMVSPGGRSVPLAEAAADIAADRATRGVELRKVLLPDVHGSWRAHQAAQAEAAAEAAAKAKANQGISDFIGRMGAGAGKAIQSLRESGIAREEAARAEAARLAAEPSWYQNPYVLAALLGGGALGAGGLYALSGRGRKRRRDDEEEKEAAYRGDVEVPPWVA